MIMADHCSFCDTRRPIGGTKIVITSGGWIEFCDDCKDVELTNSDTGETLTAEALFNQGREVA